MSNPWLPHYFGFAFGSSWNRLIFHDCIIILRVKCLSLINDINWDSDWLLSCYGYGLGGSCLRLGLSRVLCLLFLCFGTRQRRGKDTCKSLSTLLPACLGWPVCCINFFFLFFI